VEERNAAESYINEIEDEIAWLDVQITMAKTEEELEESYRVQQLLYRERDIATGRG